MKYFSTLIVIVLLSIVSVKSCSVKSIYPSSLKSLKGTISIDLVSSTNSMTLTDIKGVVYDGKTPIVYGNAKDVIIPAGSAKVDISGEAFIYPGTSTRTAIMAAMTNLENLTFTATCTIKDNKTGAKQTVTKKNVKVKSLFGK